MPPLCMPALGEDYREFLRRALSTSVHGMLGLCVPGKKRDEQLILTVNTHMDYADNEGQMTMILEFTTGLAKSLWSQVAR